MSTSQPLEKADIQNVPQHFIVFCHLRWDSVFQRPHHIVSRLSTQSRVLFVEEPIDKNYHSPYNSDAVSISDNLTVLHPHLNFDLYDEEYYQKVQQKAEELGLKNPVLWIYSPMFYRIAKRIESSTLIYDCMDELSLFNGAAIDLLERERELINDADVIFTGGKSLYESKKKLSDKVHCFPSSVDRAHFEKSLDPFLAIPEDIRDIPKPVVGFYGVIDERIDYQLLHDMAVTIPNISFVMIGPYAKINPDTLPQAKNLHYLGKKSYDELPQYLRKFDIAMMPFALNDATKFISPTKTLEFMAAGKPIISTAIYDVVRDYKNEVAIISSVEEAKNAIYQYLDESQEEKKTREAAERAIIEKTSWDNTVASMKSLIANAGKTNKAESTKTTLHASA